MIFVYPPTIDYAGQDLWQRPQQLARALVDRGHRFQYANRTQRPGREIEIVGPDVEIVHDWNAFEFPPDTVLLCSWSEHRNLFSDDAPAGKRAALKVFDYLDAFPEWHQGDIEVLTAADLVLCTSAALEETARQHRTGPVVRVPNACRPEDWTNPGPPPEWLTALPGPRVMFSGYVGPWVDCELLYDVARRCPTYTFVMVGPAPCRVSGSPDNIHWQGAVPYTDLAAIAGGCHAGIVPFRVDSAVVQAADPIKQYEYLAAGLPVVSTMIREARSPVVVTFDGEQMAQLLKVEVRIDCAERRVKRQRYAADNSWDARAAAIEAAVAELAVTA